MTPYLTLYGIGWGRKMGNKATLVLVVVGVSALLLWSNNATVADGRSVLKYITDGLAGGQITEMRDSSALTKRPGTLSPVIIRPTGTMPVQPDNLPTLPLPGQGAGGYYGSLLPLGSIWGTA